MSGDGANGADLRRELLGALGLAEWATGDDGRDGAPAPGAKSPSPYPPLGIARDEDPIAQLLDLLPHLSVIQLRYLIARQGTRTNKDAAEVVGVSPRTVSRWPARVRRAVHLMAQAGAVVALHLRRRSVAEAMQVKIDGLHSEDERVRQATATQIIEWELGKAPRPASAQNPRPSSPEVHDARERLQRLIARHTDSDPASGDPGAPER